MAALGDSITRALASGSPGVDSSRHSWSAGSDAADGVTSHYERLLALDPAIAGRNYNNAVSGSTAQSLPDQAAKAVGQGVEYVTILMGANDLCASSASAMTPEADFAAHIGSALETLHEGLPEARIFVGSIPNLYRLWETFDGDPKVRESWSAGTCPSMLAPGTTAEQRRLVVDRQLAFNRILADACAAYGNCRWDNNAIYNFRFSPEDISDADYFHPSLQGQARLAEITWEASWWGGQR